MFTNAGYDVVIGINGEIYLMHSECDSSIHVNGHESFDSASMAILNRACEVHVCPPK